MKVTARKVVPLAPITHTHKTPSGSFPKASPQPEFCRHVSCLYEYPEDRGEIIANIDRLYFGILALFESIDTLDQVGANGAGTLADLGQDLTKELRRRIDLLERAPLYVRKEG